MSGPKPPEPEPDELDSAGGRGADPDAIGDDHRPGREDGSEHAAELVPLGDSADAVPGETGAYSRAYSAPESEQFISAPYVPVDLGLYDYDGYHGSDDDDEPTVPRWPWVVGVAAILAAVALVVSVSLLVTRTGSGKLASPTTMTTSSAPPLQDEIITTKPSPPPPSPVPPPPPTSEIPTATETQTVTVTPPPPPPPTTAATTTAPPPVTGTATTPAAAPPATTTTLAGPRQVTYSVTGTKAPGDIISVTYVDASGRRRTQHNVYIPWSMTVTPISQSEVGSVEASSLFRVSRLNCSIITSDGTVLSSNTNDAPQTSC
ncbi:hypothetical protein H7H78_05550 [Mycobacterium shinjukuense]|uniref:Probable transport accessory protein MmpS3 n=1 Tax=Mycobacterium shinjukuense TaxID=398694 RepID=A0A7I7MLP9_9MYCO|nr:MmpS family transport accessory protein [Mycobacterium shinjukuense]MCV6984926.1 hypothetical protein [Mycobacterium shinjukuense]ORB70368.1 hypothetical protein BST45_06240 [Mycobacterium shinjukuense]BBX73168.1 putative transport accessory protein MmpS3 [Mycobacterium shinjukuense]